MNPLIGAACVSPFGEPEPSLLDRLIQSAYDFLRARDLIVFGERDAHGGRDL